MAGKAGIARSALTCAAGFALSVAYAGIARADAAATANPLCGEYLRRRSEYAAKNHELYVALDCMYKNAKALAAGTDSADTIAAAVADLCKVEITMASFLQRQHYKSSSADGLDGLEAKYRDVVTKEARIEVLRQRAGHCGIP